ncbi:beta-N-acetylhexosaminidase [Halobacteriovorax sp. ZH4_bin.1]|uniref:beta-N-acetylhexosaminidase n=1 Tax=unclassified Halobacteriovorax TaxID=2639665 RepID=UPI003713A610
MNNILGQLFITGISGTQLTTEEESFIQKENIGGVILFKQNYESPAQLAELINNIQSLRDNYPLFIATDHEGGRVQRFREGFTIIPPMLDVAKTASPKLCFEISQLMSNELLSCGVNLNLGPVCDIFTNPKNTVIGDRAFGDNADDVTKFVSAIIRGQQTSGIMSCAKHFPGHGDTLEDSHFKLPVVNKSLEELRENEFIPFVKAVKARVDFVMMAHLKVDAIDPENICTFSKKAYELIREELRFKKVIISDDMEMKAISDEITIGEAALKALSAGADVIEYRSFEACREAYDYVKQAFEAGDIDKVDISQKYERVLELKKKYLSNYSPTYIPDVAGKVGTKENLSIVEQVNQG